MRSRSRRGFDTHRNQYVDCSAHSAGRGRVDFRNRLAGRHRPPATRCLNTRSPAPQAAAPALKSRRLMGSTRTASTFDASGEANWIAARDSADDCGDSRTSYSRNLLPPSPPAEKANARRIKPGRPAPAAVRPWTAHSTGASAQVTVPGAVTSMIVPVTF